MSFYHKTVSTKMLVSDYERIVKRIARHGVRLDTVRMDFAFSDFESLRSRVIGHAELEELVDLMQRTMESLCVEPPGDAQKHGEALGSGLARRN